MWPEYPERSARANLCNVLANVCQLIGDRVLGDREANPPFLCVERQTIQFNPEADVQVDVRAFSEGLELVGDSLPVHAEAIQKLEATVALYQGGFLEGFSLPDSSALRVIGRALCGRSTRRGADAAPAGATRAWVRWSKLLASALGHKTKLRQ